MVDMTLNTPMQALVETRSSAGGGRLAWITGAGGFLGGAVGRKLSALGWRCIGLGHGAARFDSALNFSGDLEPALFAEAAKIGLPELVFHAGGGASVATAQADPEADFRASVLSTGDLIHFLGHRAPRAHVIYPSSAAIYGAQPKGAIAEHVAPNPVSHYGWHKLASETLCRQGSALYGLRVTIIRFFSLFGAGLRKQLLWDIATRALNGSEMVFSGSGDETRDFLHIDDATALVWHLSENVMEDCRIVNGGSGNAITVRRVVELMLAALDREGIVPHFTGEIRGGDPRDYQADVNYLSSLGFLPRRRLESTTAEYAAWAASTWQALPGAAERRQNVVF
jgi:UDP-glucose 4-epimerase